VLYQGLSILGSGAIVGGLTLGAITACMIDRNFMKAAAFAFVGALLTFFGFMHSEAIGVAQSPTVALSYVLVGLVLVGCAKFATSSAVSPVTEPEVPMGAHVEVSA